MAENGYRYDGPSDTLTLQHGEPDDPKFTTYNRGDVVPISQHDAHHHANLGHRFTAVKAGKETGDQVGAPEVPTEPSTDFSPAPTAGTGPGISGEEGASGES